MEEEGMKQKKVFVLFIGCIVAALGVLYFQPFGSSTPMDNNLREHTREDTNEIIERMKWFRDVRKSKDGYIPFRARAQALEQLERNLRTGKLLPQPQLPGTWQAIGPEPLYDGIVPYSGRVTAIVVHPSNSNIAYLGGAQGGVWKTTDGGTTWVPLTDNQVSLASGALAIDPQDPNTIYVGTGEPNQSCDSYFGSGILKSTDGGTTWTVLGQSIFSGTSISKILVHPTQSNTLWVANTYGVGGFVCIAPAGTYGVWKSTDGGGTWTRTLTIGSVSDLVINPFNANILYAGVPGVGIYKSTDGGNTWTQLGGGLPTTNVGVIQLAMSPTTSNVIYASIENASNGRHLGLFKSTDGGATWTSLSIPTSGTCMGFSLSDICTYFGGAFGQCWYDHVLHVASDGKVWLGGVGLFYTANDGASWNDVCPSSLHVDFHAITEANNGAIWVGNDGGVFKTSDGGSSWQNLNTNLQITQFYPGTSLHPSNSNKMLGGTQDNGTVAYSGSNAWDQVFGGDGAWTAYDLTNPDTTFYVSYIYLQIFKTTNGGASFVSATSGLTDAGTSDAAFIAPYVMCPSNANILIAGSDEVWKTTNGASSWTSLGVIGTTGDRIRALAFDPLDSSCNTFYAGKESGMLFRTTDGGSTWTQINTGFGTYPIQDIVIDPANRNVGYVALGGFGHPHLYVSKDILAPTPTWNPTDAGIPDIPINAILVDPNDPSSLYAGTDIGIFVSNDGGLNWSYDTRGHPRIAVFELRYDPLSRTIVSFTHGRGAFRLSQVVQTYNLTVTKTGSGSGTVTSSPAGIDCGTTCSADFSAGITVTLTATPSSNSVFTGWGGDADCSDGVVTMSADVSCTATFELSSLTPVALQLNNIGSNGVWDSSETAQIIPTWKNNNTTSQTVSGTLSNFVLPSGATGSITDSQADYGTISAGGTADCATATGNCYGAQVSTSSFQHNDVLVTETLNGSIQNVWTLHVGPSFSDVSKVGGNYFHVETMFHHGVTGGCGSGKYCPKDNVGRGMMAVFIARAMYGTDPPAVYTDSGTGRSYDCTDGLANTFADVDDSKPYCAHVHYLWAKGVVAGCGSGKYCPASKVTRGQMAVFISVGMLNGAQPPASYTDPVSGRSYDCTDGGANYFTDVKDSAGNCAHVHYLWTKQVIAGCGNNTYCPTNLVTRGQMAVFIVNGFQLILYQP